MPEFPVWLLSTAESLFFKIKIISSNQQHYRESDLDFSSSKFEDDLVVEDSLLEELSLGKVSDKENYLTRKQLELTSHKICMNTQFSKLSGMYKLVSLIHIPADIVAQEFINHTYQAGYSFADTLQFFHSRHSLNYSSC